MLIGKQFNRAVRGLTLVYEALMVLFYDAFFQWCRDENKFSHIEDDVWKTVCDCFVTFDSSSQSAEMMKKFFVVFNENILPLTVQFREHGSKSSPTFAFWEMFIRAVEIMLANVRAERDGLWQLHLQSVAAMLPYFFVTNRTNYARWTPAYILDMLNLPQTITNSFMSGEFSVKQKPGTFNGVWSDMATEKTIIKDSKGSSGIVGLTRQKPALLRWMLTRHILAHFSSEMRVRSGIATYSDIGSEHEELRPTAMTRDEQQVKDLINYMHTNMTDPFDIHDPPKVLVNISTGMQASKDVQDALLKSVDRGNQMVKSFVEGCFNENENRVFYSPISRSTIKTFEDMNKTSKLKCKSGELIRVHVNPEMIFRRALALANVRDDVSVDTVLSYPVGPVPSALFHDDGTMRKCCKSDMIHLLEEDVCSSFTLPSFDISKTVLIKDGMGLIQCLDVKKTTTFGDLARNYFKALLTCFNNAGTIMDVFDRYDLKHSTKSAERVRRTKSFGAQKIYQVIEGRTVPDWKKFLCNPENKQSFLRLLGHFAVESFDHTFLNDHILYLAGVFQNPEVVGKFSCEGMSYSADLNSSQEEADTRIVLHFMFADAQFGSKNQKGRVVVQSSDTDVLILCVHYFPQMLNTEEMWFYTGSVSSIKDGKRFIPVHEICQTIGPSICILLPAAHAVTGCDTTCSFFSLGKKSMYKLLRNKADKFQNLVSLSTGDQESAIDASRQFVAALYDSKDKFKDFHADLNKLRVKLATTKDVSLVRLPPCEASFIQHTLRAMYQTKVWMSAHEAKPPIQSPIGCGWEESTEGLKPVFFEGPMSSDFLQDLVCSCRGKSSCSTNCVCYQQNLACTSICACEGSETCKNALTNTFNEDDDSDN